jgi:DNA-binding response OmpR family regulator
MNRFWRVIIMICVVVSREKEIFSSVEQALIKNNMGIEWIDSGKKLLALLAENPTDKKIGLVVIDGNLPGENARDLVEQVIMQAPMTNCVATSALSPEDFHETFEGLGVLMQLPLKPNDQDAQKLVTHLNKILAMNA